MCSGQTSGITFYSSG